MNIPFFSICIPVYKSGKTLHKCIESITSQQYNDYEIIIVDDGSPDDSGKIADEIAEGSSRVSVIHQQNKGLFHARITAFRAARGRYILCLDSDDWHQGESLACLAEAAEKTQGDVIIFNNYDTASDDIKRKFCVLGDRPIVWHENKKQFFEIYFNTFWVSAVWKKAVRRELIDIEAISGYPRIGIAEDWIHSFYPYTRAEKIVYIPDVLYNYYFNFNSMTKKKFDPDIFESYRFVFELKKQFIAANPGMFSEEEINCQYIHELAKSAAIQPAVVMNVKEYFDYLSRVRQDEQINTIYAACRKSCKRPYRFIMDNVFAGRFRLVLFIKRIVVGIRHLVKK